MHDIDLGRVLEHLHRQVRGRARSGGRVVELARLALRERDEFRERVGLDLWIDDQQVRRDRNERYVREILHRIVGQLRIRARRDRVRAGRAEREGVTVRGRLGRGVRADRSAGACLVFDDHLLAEALAELLRDDARHDVGGASRREADDQLDGPVGVIALAGRQTRPSEHSRHGGNGCNHAYEVGHSSLLGAHCRRLNRDCKAGSSRRAQTLARHYHGSNGCVDRALAGCSGLAAIRAQHGVRRGARFGDAAPDGLRAGRLRARQAESGAVLAGDSSSPLPATLSAAPSPGRWVMAPSGPTNEVTHDHRAADRRALRWLERKFGVRACCCSLPSSATRCARSRGGCGWRSALFALHGDRQVARYVIMDEEHGAAVVLSRFIHALITAFATGAPRSLRGDLASRTRPCPTSDSRAPCIARASSRVPRAGSRPCLAGSAVPPCGSFSAFTSSRFPE